MKSKLKTFGALSVKLCAIILIAAIVLPMTACNHNGPAPDPPIEPVTEIGKMPPVELHLRRANFSEEHLAVLKEARGGMEITDMFYFCDECGEECLFLPQGTVEDGITKGITTVITGNPDGLIEWGVGSLIGALYGGGAQDPTVAALEAINVKLDLIINMLNEVLNILKKADIGADMRGMTDIRDPLWNEVLKLNDKLKEAEADIPGNIGDVRKGAQQSVIAGIHDIRIGGNTIYQVTANLGDHMLRTTPGHQSGKNLFDMTDELTKLCKFPWDHQDVTFYNNTINYFMAVYLQALAYCNLSLRYQLEKHPDNRIDLMAEWHLLFGGDSYTGPVNGKRVSDAYNARVKYDENPNYAVHKPSQQIYMREPYKALTVVFEYYFNSTDFYIYAMYASRWGGVDFGLYRSHQKGLNNTHYYDRNYTEREDWKGIKLFKLLESYGPGGGRYPSPTSILRELAGLAPVCKETDGIFDILFDNDRFCNNDTRRVIDQRPNYVEIGGGNIAYDAREQKYVRVSDNITTYIRFERDAAGTWFHKSIRGDGPLQGNGRHTIIIYARPGT